MSILDEALQNLAATLANMIPPDRYSELRKVIWEWSKENIEQFGAVKVISENEFKHSQSSDGYIEHQHRELAYRFAVEMIDKCAEKELTVHPNGDFEMKLTLFAFKAKDQNSKGSARD